jgi:D-alanine-D-alanine ligase
MASALAMDKFRTKLLWQAAGLPIPEYALLTADSDFADIEEELGLPIFVKPAHEGSSIGITKVKERGTLKGLRRSRQIRSAGHRRKGRHGRRIHGRHRPVTTWWPCRSSRSSRPPSGTTTKPSTTATTPLPVPLRPAGSQGNGNPPGALEAFRILGGRGWGRVDFLMDEDGNHYFLEVNTAPGMTDHSLVPMAARVAGMDYPALVRRVLELAAND